MIVFIIILWNDVHECGLTLVHGGDERTTFGDFVLSFQLWALGSKLMLSDLLGKCF